MTAVGAFSFALNDDTVHFVHFNMLLKKCLTCLKCLK